MKQLTDRFIFGLTDYCVDDFFPQYDIVKISPNIRALRNPSPRQINFLITKAIHSITGVKAKATAYNCSGIEDWNKMSAYMMFDKSQHAFEQVRNTVEKISGLKATLLNDIITQNDDQSNAERDAFKYSMVQLLLGYMDNNLSDELGKDSKDKDVWNNTMGKTVYFGEGKDWHRKWTDTTNHYDKNHNLVWSGRDLKGSDIIVGMSIRVNQEGILQMNAESYVKLKKETADKVRLTLGYSFDKYGRFLPAVMREGREYWFKKGEETVRPNISFIDYSNLRSFESSRMGILAKYFERIDTEIGSKSEKPLLEIRPWNYNGMVERIHPVLKDKEVLKKCIAKVKNKLSLCVADIPLKEEKLCMAISIIKDTLDNTFGITNVSDQFDESCYNLLLCHDKDYYINKKLPDMRREYATKHPSASIQGITYEQFVQSVPEQPLQTGDKEEDDKNERAYKAALKAYQGRVINMLRINIISLAIKHDLLKAAPKITIVDVSRFNLSAPIFFAIRQKEGKQDIYYYMKLLPDGKMKFNAFDGERHYERNDYERIVQAFQKHDWSTQDPDNNIELAAWQNLDDIYIIVKTIEHPVPAFREIHDELKSTDKVMNHDELSRLYEDFKQWLPSYDQQPTMEEVTAYDEHMQDVISSTAGRNITYKKLQGVLGYKDFRHMYNAFNAFMTAHNIKIDPHLRNNENKDRLGLLNLVDGYHFATPDYENLSDTMPYSETYCIGSKDALGKNGINRGFLYRRVERTNHQPIEKEFVETLLGMNIVDFVKLGQWTVKPFPVKYLNEYSDIVRLSGGLPDPDTPLQKSMF